MQFALFLLLNAIIILRPEDLFPAVTGVRFYLICFVLCAIASIPTLTAYFTDRPLRERPVTVCVLCFFAATLFSRFGRGDLEGGLTCLEEFGKDIGYFLLLVATLTTRHRLVFFLRALAVLSLVQVAVALLNHHEILTFETIKLAPHVDYDAATGELTRYNRLVGWGIYNDPNDLSLCISSTAVICCFNFFIVRNLIVRLLWLVPLPLLAHALAETHSRGGLLGVAIGLVAFLYARYGTTRMLPLAVLVVAGLLAMAGGGRQTDFRIEGTGNQRLQIWSEGFQAMNASLPSLVFGIGYERYEDEVNMVAHNSFVHCYVETGLVGGSLFVAAFALAAWGTFRGGNSEAGLARHDLRELYPCILALVAGYAGGCYSLSRQYIGPTYLMLGLAAAYIDLTLPRGDPWRSRRLVVWVAVIGVMAFVAIRLLCYFLVKY